MYSTCKLSFEGYTLPAAGEESSLSSKIDLEEINDAYVEVGRTHNEELAGRRLADAARVPSDEARKAISRNH